MTVERVRRTDGRVGCVVGVETGVLLVLTDAGEVRASLDGCLLAAVARDRSALPGVGDWVELRRWPDHRITVRRTLAMATPLAEVVDLRRERAARRG